MSASVRAGLLRQGDVVLIRIDRIPDDATRVGLPLVRRVRGVPPLRLVRSRGQSPTCR